MTQCKHCGKTNPADIHTCTPPDDRTLLELAAKAAGNELLYYDEPSGLWYADETLDEGGVYWHPLAYDSDALELAVDLRIEIGFDPKAVEATAVARACEVDGQTIMPWAWEELEPDPYAATRRAIVRVAAEIGREMK